MPLYLDMDVPNNWETSDWTHVEVKRRTLYEYDHKYQEIKDLMSGVSNCTIRSIEKIENPFLWGCYLMKKKEYESKGISFMEKALLHCTGESNISSIIRDNLDWRRSTRTKFGQGVSFSPSASYAHTYANIDIGSFRAMIVAKVLVGRSVEGGYTTCIPPSGYDTTTGNGGRVYVKYYDNEFYPEYVIMYSGPIPQRRRYRFLF